MSIASVGEEGARTASPACSEDTQELVACPGKEENAKEQRTGSRNQGKVTASQAAHCRLDVHKAKNARKVQPHEKPIATQFKEEIRVMNGTDFRSLAVCSPRAHLGISLSAATYRYCTSTSPVPVQPWKKLATQTTPLVLQFFQVKYFRAPNEDFVYI